MSVVLEEETILLATDIAWPDNPTYIPHEPTARQHVFLWLDCQEAFYGGAAGGGKALHVDTPIPTPTGWTTMGELREGDEIFDEHGDVTTVAIAHRNLVKPTCYRLTFDDGDQIIADGDHRWNTYSAKELVQLSKRTPEYRARRREQRASRATGLRSAAFTAAITARNQMMPTKSQEAPSGSIRTTTEIFKTQQTVSGRTNYAVRVADALMTPDIDLPMDPYLLGLWLGDGATSHYVFTTADDELWQAFEDAGYDVKKGGSPYEYRVRGIRFALRAAGVFKNKHIPDIYLRASYDQRLALLQGLMDSDGACKQSGSVGFGNMNHGLTEGLAELARSLGSKCRTRDKRVHLNGKFCGIARVVTWSPDYPAFRLDRKLDGQRLDHRRTTKFHYIVKVEKIKPVPMRCITVSNESGMFLVGESMIPTHNSDALLMAALQYVDDPDYRCLILRKSFKALNLDGAIMDRASRWLDHTDASWNANDYRWTFPSGARIQFGYLQHSKDRARYQSAEFQCIIFDELTEFDEADYRFMFSRLRKLKDSPIPIRMRAASNPGGVGGKWVKDRFVKPSADYQSAVAAGEDPEPLERPFVPAKLSDNPHVDQDEYKKALENLDPALMEQLLNGNWDSREPGDWMIHNPFWLDACEALGAKLWKDHQSGAHRLPDPVSVTDKHGGSAPGLVNCMDWGEHTQSYVVWALPTGGIFVPPSEVVKLGEDPAIVSRSIMQAAQGFKYPLIQSNYDAAGIQSMRTYLGVMRKIKQYARLRSYKIPFGEYKKEAIGYLRTLARRTHTGVGSWDADRDAWELLAKNYHAYADMLGEDSPRAIQAKEKMDAGSPWRVLAIHPDNAELLRQLRAWRRKDAESDEAIKEDDHGPDALIAGVAPTAREFREFVEQEMREAVEPERMEYENDPDALTYERTYT